MRLTENFRVEKRIGWTTPSHSQTLKRAKISVTARDRKCWQLGIASFIIAGNHRQVITANIIVFLTFPATQSLEACCYPSVFAFFKTSLLRKKCAPSPCNQLAEARVPCRLCCHPVL